MAEIIKLEKEYFFGTKKVNEIILDFDNLSGKDLLIAEKDFKKRNKGATVKELEDGWLVTVAGIASDTKYGDLLTLKGKDYVKVLNATRNFLIVSDSEETILNTENEETEASGEALETE